MRKILSTTVLFSLICCIYPQDPENSYEEAQTGALLVGAVENAPYVEYVGNSYSGSEVEIIRDFAEQNNLEIEFLSGSESELVKKLEKFKIHVVIGGFTKNTIWKKKAGFTVPYDEENHIFLIPKGENRLLENLEMFIFKNLKK